VGNAAHDQFQLDVYGEVLDALHQARLGGIRETEQAWHVQCALANHVESKWKSPDNGLWETRSEPRHFTHSKVMAWVALDRMIDASERYGLKAPVERWRSTRDEIHADVCASAFDSRRQTFTQSYGATTLDASTLLMPLVGFLPAADSRITGTVKAVEEHLMVNGLVLRYDTVETRDGLPPGEGAFLACSFWLADVYELQGRHAEAQALFERLLALRNDVGLLSEEYDPVAKRFLGNFPQAFSHVALVDTGLNLGRRTARRPAEQRASSTA
jgi:GH15 family glucan-1,4-alpha-glucosidase